MFVLLMMTIINTPFSNAQSFSYAQSLIAINVQHLIFWVLVLLDNLFLSASIVLLAFKVVVVVFVAAVVVVVAYTKAQNL